MVKKPTKAAIKEDLLDQLERNGRDFKYNIDLVHDYICMWEIKNELVKDIKERGVSVAAMHGKKKNESIELLNKTNAQMLKILNELGLKTQIEVGGDDEEM